MAFVDPATPNLADYTTFVYAQGVSTDQLPTGSNYITWSYDYGLGITVSSTYVSQPLYVLACYNAGFHHLIRIAQDQPNETFFADLRAKYNLLAFTAGAVISASDQGTSQTLTGSEGLSNLSLLGMDLLKTPWGQTWLQYAQAYGPNVLGVS